MSTPPTPTNELFDSQAAREASVAESERCYKLFNTKGLPMALRESFYQGARWMHERMRKRLEAKDEMITTLYSVIDGDYGVDELVKEKTATLTQKLSAAEAELARLKGLLK